MSKSRTALAQREEVDVTSTRPTNEYSSTHRRLCLACLDRPFHGLCRATTQVQGEIVSAQTNRPATAFRGVQMLNPPWIFSRAGIRTSAYWIFTLLVVFENQAGFVWFVLRLEYMRLELAHLGYPQYFMNILGPWQ